MSEPTKKLHISTARKITLLIYEKEVKEFCIPAEKAKGLILLLSEFQVNHESPHSVHAETISADEVFKELDQEFGRAGSALQGARLKEGLTQIELARMLKISQTDLSKMEHGKRPIGKKMASRLAHALNVDYRIFL